MINKLRCRLSFILLVIVSIFGISLLPQQAKALFSKDDIERNIPGGNQQAIEWDNSCWNTMHANRLAGMDPRTAINQGGAYRDMGWISNRGIGSQREITVDYGTTSVPLQLNSMVFLCSSMVDLDGAGADYPQNDYRVVQTSNAPNDRYPNPMGGNTNWPARTAWSYRVDYAYISSGLGSINLSSGTTQTGYRKNDTRYWFATDVDFDYIAPTGGLTSSQTITINVVGPIMNQYYNTGHYCLESSSQSWSYWAYGNCQQLLSQFTIQINVKPRIVEWNLSTATGIYVNNELRSSGTTAEPGEYVRWKHSVTNNGPDKTDKDITVTSKKSGSFSGIADTLGSISSTNGLGNDQSISYRKNYDNYPITQYDVNKRFCRDTRASPRAWNNSGSVISPPSCFSVPYNYELTPEISGNVANGVVETGGIITVTPFVTNPGPTISKLTDWEIVRTVDSNPGKIIHSDSNNIKPVFNKGKNLYFNKPTEKMTPYDDNDTDLPVGSNICYVLRVLPGYSKNGIDGGWITSSKYCVVVGKKPKVQIWGGDLISLGDVITSKSAISGVGAFGSWVEYAIYAQGTITNAGSGAAFVDKTIDSSNVCNYSKLSFTNTPTGRTNCVRTGSIGYYTNAKSLPDISFPDGDNIPGSSPLSFAPNTKLSGTYDVGNKNIILLASELPASKSIIIKTSGTITINGDQKYVDGPYTNINQLPQLVLIARNIDIADTVERIDAWLIAKDGNINTCSSVAGSPLPSNGELNINKCNKKLIVNGPVVVNKLYLRRTANADKDTRSEPAEVFNLRADAYLWAFNRASDGRIRTVYSTELPPRY